MSQHSEGYMSGWNSYRADSKVYLKPYPKHGMRKLSKKWLDGHAKGWHERSYGAGAEGGEVSVRVDGADTE